MYLSFLHGVVSRLIQCFEYIFTYGWNASQFGVTILSVSEVKDLELSLS